MQAVEGRDSRIIALCAHSLVFTVAGTHSLTMPSALKATINRVETLTTATMSVLK